jgi:hypothetical protein
MMFKQNELLGESVDVDLSTINRNTTESVGSQTHTVTVSASVSLVHIV